MDTAGTEHVGITYAPGGLEIFEEHHFCVELHSYVIESTASFRSPRICSKPCTEKIKLCISGIQVKKAEVAVPYGPETQFGHQFGIRMGLYRVYRSTCQRAYAAISVCGPVIHPVVAETSEILVPEYGIRVSEILPDGTSEPNAGVAHERQEEARVAVG